MARSNKNIGPLRQYGLYIFLNIKTMHLLVLFLLEAIIIACVWQFSAWFRGETGKYSSLCHAKVSVIFHKQNTVKNCCILKMFH